MRCTLLILLLAFFFTSVYAQSPRTDTTDVTAAVEAALEATGDADDASVELVEWLTERAQHPIDINRAAAAELARLPGLSMPLARRIVQRRDERGPYASMPELRTVPGMDASSYRAARPFLTIDSHSTDDARSTKGAGPLLNTLNGRFIQRLTRRLDVGPGYADDTTRTTYAGSPARLYTRLHLTARRQLSLNLTLEKDPGEAFRWHPRTSRYGFDHVTAHAALHDVGRLETLVVGDFSAAFGQGLALWRSFALTKGRDGVASVARQGAGLSPYSSTEENHFFRGVGATVRLAASVTATAFGSRRARDATLSHDTDGTPMVTTFATSGLHRTPHELNQRDAVRENVLGVALEVGTTRGHLGIVGYRSRLSHPIAPSTALYRRFDATGTSHSVVSAYANILVGDASLFGELARSASSAWGGLGGAQIDLSTAAAVVAVRHYPHDFTSRHGRAFGTRGSPPQNEAGIYLGLDMRPARTWRLRGYFDQYRFPWLRYQTPRPTTGHDTRLVIEHDPRPWLHYYLQLRTETREEGTSIQTPTGRRLAGVHPVTRQSARLHGDYTFSSRLRLRTRLEVTRTFDAHASSTGLLLYQGLRWQARPWLRLDGRWALFETDGFAARIYAYEHDLLYTFSVPVFSGRGERQYLLLNVTPMDRLRLEVKYGVTRYRDVTSVGSGLDAVPGTRLREVRAQVRWRL